MTTDHNEQARQITLERVQGFIGNYRPEAIFELEDAMHPADLADVLWQDINPDDARVVFNAMSTQERALILAEAEEKAQLVWLEGFEPEQIGEHLSFLSVDDGVDLLNALPIDIKLEALCFVESDIAGELRHLTSYPEKSAGGMMTTEFITTSEDEKIGDLIKQIKSDEGESESVYVIYVTGERNKLLGVITTRELLEVSIHDVVGDFMNPDVIYAKVDEDREDVARRILRYNLSMIPVVDARHSIIGIITADDVLEVVEEEGSEDVLLLAGASGESDAGEPLLTMVSHRAPYLIIPVLAGLIMSEIMSFFGIAGSNSGTGSSRFYDSVVAFVPMVLALAGTVGMQTSAVLVRGYAVGQIVSGRRLGVFISELRLGFALGLLCALVAGPAMGVLLGDFLTGMLLGCTLWISITWTSVAATSIVVGSEAAGFDPALVAGPVMIAISDLSAVALFLGLGSVLI